MKKNNKGYSLIELMITIAIFSIIMIAIITMMRTTLASYRDGYFESNLQEEAQIVANQVADVLVDAKVYQSNGDTYSYDEEGNVTGVAGKSYTFVGNDDGAGSTIILSSEGTKLNYNGHVLTDKLAEGGFVIDGLNRRASDDTTSVYDNAATVKITIDADGRKYTATKDVYFRNQIEYHDTAELKNPYDVSGAPTIIGGGGGGADKATILRYSSYNLSSEDDIVYDAELSDKAKLFFTMTPGSNTQVKNPISGKTPQTYVITVTAQGDYNNNNNSVASECYVTGLTSKGTSKTIYLVLDSVAADSGSGVYVSKNNTNQMTDTGYTTDVHIKGININNAIKAGVQVKFNATITSNGNPKMRYKDYTLKAVTTSLPEKIANDSANYTFVPNDNPGGEQGKYELGVAPSPLNGDILISCGKNSGGDTNAMNNNKYGYLGDINNDNRLNIDFTIGGSKTVSASYRFLMNGQSLEKINASK